MFPLVARHACCLRDSARARGVFPIAAQHTVFRGVVALGSQILALAARQACCLGDSARARGVFPLAAQHTVFRGVVAFGGQILARAALHT